MNYYNSIKKCRDNTSKLNKNSISLIIEYNNIITK